MPTTINPTLPQEWKDNITYNEGDKVSYYGIIYRSNVNNNLNKPPYNEPDYWTPSDIYMKNFTVMEHGDYSGDASFWERDNIYIDGAGWVYVNNENTGINVKGRDGETIVSFEDLTPAQIEQLKGLRGIQGPQGPAGPQGPQGPMGEVVLTDEQIAVLKGETGDSAYQSWLNQGHTGSEADFINWLASQNITVDTELNSSSVNPVQNKAITLYLENLVNRINDTITALQSRIVLLENQLQTVYNGETCKFQFGITENGKYGYIKHNSSDVTPFDNNSDDMSSMFVMEDNIGLLTDIGESNSEPLSFTNISDELQLQPASFTLDLSNDTGEDNTVLMTSNLTQAESFTDAFESEHVLYDHGEWLTEPPIELYNLTLEQTSLNSVPLADGTASKTGIGVRYINAPYEYSRIYVEITSINETSSFSNTILYFYNDVQDSDTSIDLNLDYILQGTPYRTITINKGDTVEIELPFQYEHSSVLITPTVTNNFKITKIYYK